MSDPCECLFNHETMMRRLLSLLNDAQTECTDSDCLTGGGDGAMPANPVGVGNGLMLMTVLWSLFAMLMFFFRPSSLRAGDSSQRSSNAEGKPISSLNNNNNNDNGPPAPDVH